MSNFIFLFKNCSLTTLNYSSTSQIRHNFKKTKICFNETVVCYLANNSNIESNFEYNQKINLQLKNFLKNYKYEKLINNYKEFNKQMHSNVVFIPKGDTPVRATLYSLGSSPIGEQLPFQQLNGLTNGGLNQLVDQRYDLLSLSPHEDASQDNIPVTQRVLPINITYNKLKQLLKSPRKKRLNINNKEKLYLNLHSPSFAPLVQRNKTLPGDLLCYAPLKGEYNKFHCPKGANERELKWAKGVSFPSYSFLQTLLVKYLEITPKNDTSKSKTLLQRNDKQDSRNQHFLFNKINNKSFLGYWLIPVAGFAFITPNIFLNYNVTTVQLSSPNSYQNNKHNSSPFTFAPLGQGNEASHIKYIPLFDKGDTSEKTYTSVYLPYADQYSPSLMIKKTFNNLYTFILSKTHLSKTTNILGRIPGGVPSIDFTNTVLPVSKFCNSTQKIKLYEKIIFKLCAAKHESFVFKVRDKHTNTSSKVPLSNLVLSHKTTNQVNTLKSILYLSTINPLYSKSFINNNFNFIKINQLKLLKLKIIKLNELMSPLGNFNQLVKQRNPFLVKGVYQSNFLDTQRGSKFLVGEHKLAKSVSLQNTFAKKEYTNGLNIGKLPIFKPFDSYKEGLDLINLNQKQQTPSVHLSTLSLLPSGQSYALKGNQRGLKSPLPLLSKMLHYSILYKENTRTVKQPILNPVENKNQIILNYFLFNNEVQQTMFRLKLNLIKSIISPNTFVNTHYRLGDDLRKKTAGYIPQGGRFSPKGAKDDISKVPFQKTSRLNLGSKQFLNSLSVLFKHQKMFKNKIEPGKKIGSKLLFHLQKKRKAKKQRLETRRQKKRTRFFPRPISLRYRMFLNFINQRKQSNFNKNTSYLQKIFNKGSSLPLKGKTIGGHLCLGRKTAAMLRNPLTFAPLGQPGLSHLVRGCFAPLQHHKGIKTITLRFHLGSLLSNKSMISYLPQIKDNNYRKKSFSYFYNTFPFGNMRNKARNGNIKNFKIKANYINFKNQKSNNPPPPTEKDKDKDTMFRDFWIWAYNNTLTNNYSQNLMHFLPKVVPPQGDNYRFNSSVLMRQGECYGLPLPSVQRRAAIEKPERKTSINDTKQIKNLFAIARINWALNKTNNNSFTHYNKRYNLWGTQKLRNQSKNNKTKHLEKQFITNWEKNFLNKNLSVFYKKISSKLSQKTQKLNYLTSYTNDLIFKPKNIKIFNTTWWSNLNLKPFLNKTDFLDKQQDNFLSCSTLNFKIGSLLISSSLLLHLCALISLVSISQVRCFIKFHLILLYKLSNGYNLLIHKIVDSTIFSNLRSPSGKKIIKNLDSQNVKTNDSQRVIPRKGEDRQTRSHTLIKKFQEEPSKINILSLRQNQNKLLTYFSFNLFKKEFNQNGQKASNDLVKNLKLSGTVRCPSGIPPEGVKEGRQALAPSGRMQTLYSKLNIISPKTISLKRIVINNNINKSSLLGGQRSKPEGNRYKINQTKLYFKKSSNLLLKSFKNMISYVILKLIDLFQSSVRTLSSFFEKPAEFTTTWIAYGFLVEWSSDFITIMPENVDIYIWNVFTKISRIMPIQFVLHFNYSFLLSNLSGLNTNNTLVVPPQGDQTGLINISGFPVLLTISHLLHRRIIHLFDILMETISQPDSDLIARQEKGTLFWDIWADFLVTAADFYNVNVAALSTIKAEQNTLIENISNNFGALGIPKQMPLSKYKHSSNVVLLPFSGKQRATKGAKETYEQLSKTSFIKTYFEQSLASKQNISNNFLEMCSFDQNSKIESVLANLNRWSVNQYITYQSWHSHNGSNNSNGDLFIDYHPPKSFSHIPAIKYNSILQQPIGTLVCQIYSGIFNKQISKNVLLVNTKTTTKQVLTDYNILLIQALAGETELKIITDNAQRYALVNRGFAIGIKLLRDVFDAIALNTPCIFLLEDIHAIGERRPMLISDSGGALSEDNGAFKEDFFGSQRDEVHEKNQVVYQLTRHAITHYKKPFKGDYSLAIPTNLYLTDLFLKLPTQSTSNLSLIENHNLSIKNKIKNQSQSANSSVTQLVPKAHKNSHQEIAKTTTNLTPPSTSPFSVLLLKEEKRLKPNKIVEELPWTGLPSEQLSTKPRASYSVRAKVAILAELSLSNLSAKLDMITDLLVIIDSVRSNKGFVVFATTDIPHVLDPALRRPGRLDETICLPNISNSAVLNFNTNYEIIKSIKPRTNFMLNTTLNTTLIYNNSESKGKLPRNEDNNLLTVSLKDYNTVLDAAVKQGSMGLPIAKYYENKSLNYALISHSLTTLSLSPSVASPKGQASRGYVHSKNLKQSKHHIGFVDSKKNKDKAIAYYEVGKVLLNYYLNNQYKSNPLPFTPSVVLPPGGKKQTTNGGLPYVLSPSGDGLNLKSINYLSLYASKNKLILQLMLIFGGKIGQLLGSKNLVNSIKAQLDSRSPSRNHSPSRDDRKLALGVGSVFLSNDKSQISNKREQTSSETMLFLEREHDENLRIATSIMLSFIHKRYLYRKNLIVPKLLSFTDGNVLEEPPCPPFSSLLIPAKRFENYKRVFRDSIVSDKLGQRKAQIPFIEKLQYHSQLRSIKQLNNTIQNLAETTQPPKGEQIVNLTSIPNENLLQTTTNINWYYQNRILKRHGQYLTNQWWNGQLSEHNAETVFLSDIDWRSSFIKNKRINLTKSNNTFNLAQQKNKSDGLDILLDFPDTDQYYNPRRRRWLLNKGYWSFWFNLDKVYSAEIISTWILESIIQTYKYLHNNTELLDFVTNKFIVLGYPNTDFSSSFSLSLKNNLAASSKAELSAVKEIILANSFKRFN